jgi:hypothetical protein
MSSTNYGPGGSSWTNGSLAVTLDSSQISLFEGKISVYDATGTLLGTGSASSYGQVVTVNLSCLAPGQAATAANLGKISSLNLRGLTLDTSTNVDYFKFVSSANATFTVSSDFTQAGGTGGSLSLTALDAQQTVLATGQSQTGSLSLTVNLSSGRTYYLEVVSPAGSLFTYSLTLAKSTSTGGGGKKGGGALAGEIGDGTEASGPLAQTSDGKVSPSMAEAVDWASLNFATPLTALEFHPVFADEHDGAALKSGGSTLPWEILDWSLWLMPDSGSGRGSQPKASLDCMTVLTVTDEVAASDALTTSLTDVLVGDFEGSAL